MNDDAQQILLAALAERYGAGPFSARDAAAAIPGTLWVAAGVTRPDAGSVGRWLRAHRSASLTGKPDRSGIVRWRLRGATAPVAALQAPAPASHVPAPPLARQAALHVSAPPAPPAPPQPAPPAQHLPWWVPVAPAVPPAPAVDAGLPGPRWACGRWWAPLPESAP